MGATPDPSVLMVSLYPIQGYEKNCKARKSLKVKCDKAAALLAENGFVVRKAAADTDKPDMPSPASADGASGPNLSGAHSSRGSARRAPGRLGRADSSNIQHAAVERGRVAKGA